MAGTVGGAVAGCPGYAGYVPSCQQPLTTTNSSVTNRMPLVSRVKPSQSIGLPGTVELDENELFRDPTSVVAPRRTTEATLYATQGSTRPDPSDWKQPRTKALILKESRQRATGYFEGTATFSANTTYGRSFELEKNRDAQFYSRVQQTEHDDAVQAQLHVVKNTRSSARAEVPTEKRNLKRAGDPHMVPAQPEFGRGEKRTPLRTDQPHAVEYVRFRGAHADRSCAQQDYGTRGYNPLACMPQSVDEMTRTGQASELFAGTAKSTLGLRIPGYLGHVPQGKATAKTLDRSERPDLLKKNAQNTRLLCTSRRTLPGYCGYEPQSLVNDKGCPNRPDVGLTSSGAATHTALVASADEKGMNNTEFAKTGGIRRFFTQGDGQPDHSISEQYYVKYRPMEGSLKMGTPSERNIPKTK